MVVVMREGGRVSLSPEAEGVGVEVDGGGALQGSGVNIMRKRTMTARSEGGVVEVDDLRKRTVAAHFEAEVEAAACSRADDEATACSGAGIEDGGWWQQRNGF
jgi:hypothetical protein